MTAQDPSVAGRIGMERVIDRRYRIKSKIAKGGMSVVYRAVQLSLQRVVAMKIAAAEWAARDPALEERYEREARLGAALHKPNLLLGLRMLRRQSPTR